MMTRIYLIRHGQTDFAKNRLYCGHSDIPLNKTGRAQARCLKNVFTDMQLSAVYISDLPRAKETAEIAFKNNKVSVTEDKRLREINFGLWEGLPLDEIHKKHQSKYSKWLKKPLSITIPKGEKLLSLKKRVKDFLKDRIETQKAKDIAVVSHAGPIKIIIFEVLGIDLSYFWNLNQELAAISLVEFHNNYKVLKYFNNTSHLAKLV